MRSDPITLYRARGRPGAFPPKPEWMADIQSESHQNQIDAQGRWFTESLDEVTWYLDDFPEGTGEIITLQLPREVAELYRVSNMSEGPGGKVAASNPRAFSLRPEREFFLPADLALKATPRGNSISNPPTADEIANRIATISKGTAGFDS